MNPPPTSEPVDIFDLRVANMGSLYEEGSYRTLLMDITHGVEERATWEKEHPNEFQSCHPGTVDGKFVLPRCRECFVVRVTSTDGRRVCFLFEWSTLYNNAFYSVEDECWFIFKDYAKSNVLPPPAQLAYVPQRDVGFHVLDVNANYGSLGKKGILLGADAINGYVIKLAGLRALLQHGNTLVLKKPLRLELMNGTLTFAPVVISEPCRFGIYKAYMLDWITVDAIIPSDYTAFFTKWSSLSRLIAAGQGMKVTLPNGQVEYTSPETLRHSVCLLCNKVIG